MTLPAGLTVAEALVRATARLRRAGVEAARGDARLLLGQALGVGPEIPVGYPERLLRPGEARCFEQLIARRAAREPVSHILGRREFWGLGFQVGPAALDPRPDSETLVEATLEQVADRDAALALLDLGTGTGCLLLALLSELPRARGIGVDLSPPALALARANVGRVGLAGRADFVRGDWGAALAGTFDLVICNPPYIPTNEIDGLEPEVADHEPRRALDGGLDGLDAYRALAPGLGRLLVPGGAAIIEIGAGQADQVTAILAAGGLTPRRRRTDLAGVERCLVLTA